MLDLLFPCSIGAYGDDLAYNIYNVTFIEVSIDEYLLRSALLHGLVNMTRLYIVNQYVII